MEKVALFFEDYLYEGPDGKYIFSPTQSPENTPGNSDTQASYNATMDVAVAKELLRNLSLPRTNWIRTRTRSPSGKQCWRKCRTT